MIDIKDAILSDITDEHCTYTPSSLDNISKNVLYYVLYGPC